VLQAVTDDGTVSDAVLQDLLKFTEQETGVRKDRVLRDIVDYSFVRPIDREMRSRLGVWRKEKGIG
jgi:hypothetical protein